MTVERLDPFQVLDDYNTYTRPREVILVLANQLILAEQQRDKLRDMLEELVASNHVPSWVAMTIEEELAELDKENE